MRKLFAITLLTLAPAAATIAPQDATALDREYCSDPDVSCDCSEYPSSMECVEFDMGNLVDVSNPYPVHEAYDVQTTYDEETGVYHVHADNTTAVTHVLPTHPNGGHWSDIEEVTEYVNIVLGLDSTSETPPPMAIVDVCSTGPFEPVEEQFNGLYARWNATNGQWANVTSSSFLHDLVTGPTGEFTVGEEAGGYFTRTKTCAYHSSGNLEADQCSYVEEFVHNEEYPCDLTEDSRAWVVGTRLRVRWYDSFVGPIIGNGMFAYTRADVLNL